MAKAFRRFGARSALIPAALLSGLLLAGCSGGGPSTPAGTPSEDASSSGQEMAEPVIDRDFPDPDVLEVDGTYYAYATNGNGMNVQVAKSTDLEDWTVLDKDAMPDMPSWVIPGKTWAPEVTEVSEGNFVLYFTATNFDPARQCIGVATSNSPTGPFVAQGGEMLVCPIDEGGAIDASTFVDDDGLHLVWKNDGNCCGLATWIQTAPLSKDGLSLTGQPQKLIKQTLDWEGDLVEAPTIVKRGSTYVLLYSANSYSDGRYAIGYASAPKLSGPWSKTPKPIFSTKSSGHRYLGPGGQDVVTGPMDQDYLVLHGWDPAFTYRGMFVAPLEWDGAMPRVVLGE
ncbi:glycoside hydrolase family 43 protein [Arthrobacter monumenti]